ncbi:MAG: nucleoside-diphosphate kinase [Candidatus Methylomirabilales bacterium]
MVFIKPDAVRRGLIGEMIRRIEGAGLRVAALQMRQIEESLAREHYVEHAGRPYFNDLVAFVTSGPVVAMVVEGVDAVTVVRGLMGATDPAKSPAGTIRGDFGTSITENLIHGSDSVPSAFRELRLWWPDLPE